MICARVSAVLDSVESSLYNAPRFTDWPNSGQFGAQVAQLVEHVTENHGVGGSIPPLTTQGSSSQHFSFADVCGRLNPPIE